MPQFVRTHTKTSMEIDNNKAPLFYTVSTYLVMVKGTVKVLIFMTATNPIPLPLATVSTLILPVSAQFYSIINM